MSNGVDIVAASAGSFGFGVIGQAVSSRSTPVPGGSGDARIQKFSNVGFAIDADAFPDASGMSGSRVPSSRD